MIKANEIAKALPRYIPLVWEGDKLVTTEEVTEVALNVAKPEITILHTNDFHSSIDGRPDSATGKMLGGIARLATTIRQRREAGPTLVLDAGDSVFGSGTLWDANGAAITGRLRGAAGYELAAIGNHDLEHGLEGLAELFEGNYLFVAANLIFDEPRFSEKVRPAYLVELAGWRIGITGVTTPSTLHLVPSRMLQGVELTDPVEALTTTIKALEPLVDTIIVISHLGFSMPEGGDRELIARLAGSKVSIILGGHTHEALNPAPVIGGITVCNAGAFGANVGEVKISQVEPGIVEVRSRLLPQDESVAEEPSVAALQNELSQNFQALRDTRLPLPALQDLGDEGLSVGYHEHIFSRDREAVLLARALRETGQVDQAGICFVPILYVLGQLPKEGNEITLAQLTVTYPNIERLVEVEVEGHALKELLRLQPELVFYQQALPLWLTTEKRVKSEQLDDNGRYKIVTSELVAEGGLGWTVLPDFIISSRVLEFSCAEIIQQYLGNLIASVSVL